MYSFAVRSGWFAVLYAIFLIFPLKNLFASRDGFYIGAGALSGSTQVDVNGVTAPTTNVVLDNSSSISLSNLTYDASISKSANGSLALSDLISALSNASVNQLQNITIINFNSLQINSNSTNAAGNNPQYDLAKSSITISANSGYGIANGSGVVPYSLDYTKTTTITGTQAGNAITPAVLIGDYTDPTKTSTYNNLNLNNGAVSLSSSIASNTNNLSTMFYCAASAATASGTSLATNACSAVLSLNNNTTATQNAIQTASNTAATKSTYLKGLTFDTATKTITSRDTAGNVTAVGFSNTQAISGAYINLGYKFRPLLTPFFIAPELGFEYYMPSGTCNSLTAGNGSDVCIGVNGQIISLMKYSYSSVVKAGVSLARLMTPVVEWDMPDVDVYILAGLGKRDIDNQFSPGFKYGLGGEVFASKNLSFSGEFYSISYSTDTSLLLAQTSYTSSGTSTNTSYTFNAPLTPSNAANGTNGTGYTVSGSAQNLSFSATQNYKYTQNYISSGRNYNITAIKIGMNWYF